MAYSNTFTLRFLNVVFTIRNVVIHMAYSNIAYLCSVFSLLYLLPISLCDWSSLPAVSSSAQSVACFYVHHFRTTTGIHVMSGDWSSLYCHRLCAVMRIFWMCLNFWLKKLRVGWFSFVPAFTCSIAHDNNRSPLFFQSKINSDSESTHIFCYFRHVNLYTVLHGKNNHLISCSWMLILY